MAAIPLTAFIGPSPVTIFLDPSSSDSCISPVLVHKLDLPCSFGILGAQLTAANIYVPTDDGVIALTLHANFTPFIDQLDNIFFLTLFLLH